MNKKLITFFIALLCMSIATAQDETAIPVTGVAMEETTALTIMVGETVQLKAHVLPEDATNQGLKWESVNTEIATVDGEGTVTGLTVGKAIIRARAAEKSSLFASRVVNVRAAEAKAGSIAINEIQAANLDMFLDPSFNYGGWIELYNLTDIKLELGRLYISDDPYNLKKHRLPASIGQIEANSYKTLWFDHYGIWNMGEHNQVAFKLNYNGGTIIISDAENIIAQQDYPQAVARTSYARTTDNGEEWGVTSTPTPGKSNNGSTFATKQLDAPVVDKDAQLFTGTLQVSVDIPSGATLRYTTDGSTPTLSNGSTSATGVFSVTKTTPYRFRLFKDGMLPSQVVTRTYIYNDKDFTLPIISVNGSKEDLFGNDHGVFVQGSGNGRPGAGQTSAVNWNMDWDRPVNFEYIGNEGDGGEYRMLFNQEVDLARCGGWSRAWTPYSFKLKASKQYYGLNSLDYQFFPGKPYIKNKTLQIRNGGNDNNCRIKDPALQEIVTRSGLYIDGQQWVPVMHFINGEYRGVINMREPNNKHFAYANYGIDTDEMDQFEISPDSNYVQMTGTKDAWNELYALAKNAKDPDTYTEICKRVDMDGLLNYLAVQLYLGGDDWPKNNLKGFRDRNEGKFHFVLFDLDHAFNKGSDSFTHFKSKQTWKFDELRGSYIDGNGTKRTLSGRRTEEIEFVTIVLNLFENQDFKQAFIDRFCVITGSVFEPNRCKAIVTEMATLMEGPMSYSHATSSGGGWGGGWGWDWPWGGGWQPQGDSPWNTANSVINSLSASRISTLTNSMATFFGIKTSTRREAKLSSNVTGAKLSVNGFEIPTGSMNGYLFQPVTLNAAPLAGYEFKGWKSGNSFVSTEAEYEAPSSGKINLVAVYEPIPDDELAAQGCKPVMVNEVSAANSMYINDYFKKNDWIELYNTTDSDIDIAGMYVSDNEKKPQKYQVPADDVALNTIIPAHGYKVLWADKLDNIGTDIHTSFKLAAEGGVVIITTDQYADTLAYVEHTGCQTFGRYPDGASMAYVMNIPTIGKGNLVSMADTVSVAQNGKPDIVDPDAIHSLTKDGSISMAYAGGVVNAKSEDAAIADMQIFSVSGMKVNAPVTARSDRQYVTATVTHLPSGIYVARVRDSKGNECQIKFVHR